MAVQFNVPASPKKNVFEIDQFLGVDLTNSGANVDEVRSPNAPNMVRYVPGKVRKRMGYMPQIIVGTGTNVNRALETSDDEQKWALNNSEWTQFYTVKDGIVAGTTYYYEFDYLVESGSVNFFIATGMTLSDTDGEWVHASGNMTAIGNYSTVQGKSLSEDGSVLKIKNLSVMLDKDSDYIWRKAPEDDGRIFVKTATNEPVYGCHTLKTKDRGNDYALNENRAHGTTDSFVEYTSNQILYKTETYFAKGTKFYVEFDCETDGTAIVDACTLYCNIDDTMTHFTGLAYANANTNEISLTLGTATYVKIKKFSLMLENDSDYSWNQTYEERGIEVKDSWFFLVDKSRNYILNSADSMTLSNKTVSSGDITTSASRLDIQNKLIKVSLELTTSATVPVTKVEFGYYPTTGSTVGSPIYIMEKAAHYDHEKIEFYIDTTYPSLGGNQAIQSFVVRFTSSSSGSFSMSFSNGSIEVFDFRENFYIPKMVRLYHIGTKMYMQKDDKPVLLIFSDMNQQRSQSWQYAAYDEFGTRQDYDNLYIVDGKTFMVFDGMQETLMPVYGTGKIPKLTIAKQPSGGGIPYEPLNMLQAGFEETFYGDGTSTVFQMSLQGLDNTRPIVKQLVGSSWYYQTNFTYDAALGRITFPAAPPVSPITGEPNVSITAYKTIPSYQDKINKCSFGALFGVNGEPDRIFLSGNSDFPNLDFWSEQYMPNYFGDTYYSKLGTDDSSVMGYAIVNNYLAAFKDSSERAQNVIIREGDLIVRTIKDGNAEYEISEPAFKTINSLQGSGALSANCFGYLQTEPLFLTGSGIYAITAQDITGEKYGQNRSFYLNGALLKETNLEDACSVVYNDMYVLAVNTHLYILDGLQPVQTDKSMPYATRQYVAFYCTDVPAYTMWVEDGELWFGTTDGKVCKFATDVEDLKSYNDDGKAIECCWETPDLDGKLFYKNKTFRYFAIRMMKALRTSCKLYASKLGVWNFIKEDSSSGIIFDFNNIDFDMFSFSTDSSEKIAHTKLRVKKVDKARFKVENNNLNEPFGLFNLALEYVESGNYKG